MPTASENIQTRINNLTVELAASRNCDQLEYRMGLWRELEYFRKLLDSGALTDFDGSGTVPYEEATRGFT